MHSPIANKRALIRRALLQCAMCRDWPNDALELLVESAVLKDHPRHVEVPAQPGGEKQVLLVLSGALEAHGLGPDGSRFLLSVLGPGEITALTNLLDTVELNYGFHTRDRTTLVHLPVANLRATLDQHPFLWRDVALIALARQQGNINMLHRQALATLPQKIAQALLRLTQWSGRRTDRPEGMTLRISQADIASMVAVSRQTVNKEMQALVQHGLVSVTYGRLTIHDMTGLRKLAAEGGLPDRPKKTHPADE